MYAMLRAKNEGFRPQLLAFAQELVRTPSPSGGEAPVADRVEQAMRETGYDQVLRDEAGNVLGILHGREGGPVLLLNSHLDTAAPGPESALREPVHSGRRAGGALYGLGASDCKGGLAAQLFAGALLRRSLLPLRGTLVVAATVAEEAGGSPGVRALVGQTLRELDLAPDWAILGDPTGLGLYYGHDGWIEVDIQVQGANRFAVDDAAQAIRDGFEGAAVAGVDEPRLFQAVQPPRFHTVDGARRATIRLVRRLLPAENEGAVLGQVRQNVSLLAQASGSVAVEVAVRQENQQLYTGRTTVVRHVTHAWATDPFHPLMERSRQALSAAGCAVKPGKWVLGRLGMGTAGSALAQEFRVPTLGYGPGDEARCHAPNESVSEAQIVEAAYGTAAIAHALVGVPVCGWTADEI